MNQKTQEDRLGTAPVTKLIWSLALPAILAQLINALYNIVDRMYISRIPGYGNLALTGVGVCFPILILISAFATLVGTGGSTLASIELGKQNKDKAESILGNSFTLLIVISVILTGLFMWLKTPILMAFGASNATLPYGIEYLRIYLLGTIFVELAMGLNMFITCQGKSKIAMLSILIGAGLNIVLDPLFIFVFRLGVRGAAIATVLSQSASTLWIIRFLRSSSSALLLHQKDMPLQRKYVRPILTLGLSSFVMQATECLINVVFNRGLQTYGGDAYVGSMTIIQSLMQMVNICGIGLSQGIQPVISFNYGAGKNDRVRHAYRFGFISQIGVASIATAFLMLFPATFARIFTSNQEMIHIVATMLPIFICGWGIFGIQNAAQVAFVGLGQTKIPIFLACFRKVILLIPLAIILPHFIGTLGIFIAEPISDITSAITAGILFKLNIPKILDKKV